MPRGWKQGPQGQLRPTGQGACAVHVMKIATGEIEEKVEKPPMPEEGPSSGHSVVRETADPYEDFPCPTYGTGLPPPPRTP